MSDLLRETFAEYADRAPNATGLRDAVEARVRHDRRRRLGGTVLGAAASVALVVAGAAYVAGDPRPSAPPVAAAPAGTRWVAFHGVEVAVPSAWPEAQSDFCGPKVDSVIVERGGSTASWTAACWKQRPRVNLARIGDAGLADRISGTWVSTEEFLLGNFHAQRVMHVNALGQPVHVVIVPGYDAAVAVETDDPALARRILDTVRVRNTDAFGCAARRAALYAEAPPARPGATTVMVPPGAAEASLCRYVNGWSIASARYTGDDLTRLAGVLNALKPGLRTVPGESDLLRGYVLTFRYPEGPAVEVFVHIEGIKDVGATNGAVTGALTPALQEAIGPVFWPGAGYSPGG